MSRFFVYKLAISTAGIDKAGVITIIDIRTFLRAARTPLGILS